MRSAILFAALIFANAATADDELTVHTRQGRVRGRRERYTDTVVEAYVGIPYALPPVADLRFQKPVPMTPWKDVLDATSAKASCMQTPHPEMFRLHTEISEDCLYLNVWTPSRTKPLKPVLVWVHGGAYTFGSSYQDWYNASVLSAFNDMVVVSMNYRLGIFGFLDAGVAEAPGNVGLMDQTLVLRWVQENIEAFGGNPMKVTLSGVSAGAFSTHLHLLSPLSRHLYRRAFLMSGTHSTSIFTDTRLESVTLGNMVAESLGCSKPTRNLTTHPDEVLSCMRSKPATEVNNAVVKRASTRFYSFLPTFGNEFLPLRSSRAMREGLANNVDVLVSVTADEGSFGIALQPDHRLLDEELKAFDEKSLKETLRGLLSFIAKDRYRKLGERYLNNATPGDKQSLRKAFVDFVSDLYFLCPSKLFSELHSSKGNKVYSIVFGHRSQKSPLPKWAGVMHTADIVFYFGIPFLDANSFTQEDRDFSREVMKILATFVKDGKPVLSNGTPWEPFAHDHDVSIWFQPKNFSAITDFYKGRCDLSKRLL